MTEVTEESYTARVEKDPESNRLLRVTWLNDEGQEHNRYGPAVVQYGPDGAPEKQIWMIRGMFHRCEEEGPAIIDRDPASGLVRHEYFLLSRLHRVHGPAIVLTEERTGRVLQQRFFRDGLLCTPSGAPVHLKP